MSWPSPPFVLLVGGLHLRAAEQQGQQHRGATQHHTHYRQVHGRLTAVWQPPALRHDIKDGIGGSLQLAPCGATAVVHSRGQWCALHTGTAYPATHGTPGPRVQSQRSIVWLRGHAALPVGYAGDGRVVAVLRARVPNMASDHNTPPGTGAVGRVKGWPASETWRGVVGAWWQLPKAKANWVGVRPVASAHTGRRAKQLCAGRG